MGTYYMVKIVRRDESNYLKSLDSRNLKKNINQILKKINRQMSTFQSDSEVSLFNASRTTGWFPVSKETAAVIQESLRISQISQGAFDVTISPLIELWGFGKNSSRKIPSPTAIRTAKQKTGFKKLLVRLAPPSLKKLDPGLSCNLSAIAKGFGVDSIAQYLDLNKIKHYLIDIGGEIRVEGYNPSGLKWAIGIAAPKDPKGVHKKIFLHNQSIATSGDYRNYYISSGVRYSHTINPLTGRPITHYISSVSVIHDSCMTADALATAINVLGPEKGLQLARKQNLPVLLILRKGNNFIERMSPSFKKLALIRK